MSNFILCGMPISLPPTRRLPILLARDQPSAAWLGISHLCLGDLPRGFNTAASCPGLTANPLQLPASQTQEAEK